MFTVTADYLDGVYLACRAFALSLKPDMGYIVVTIDINVSNYNFPWFSL